MEYKAVSYICSLSIECLRQFLLCTKSDELLASLDAAALWDQFQNPDTYQDAFTTLARYAQCVCCTGMSLALAQSWK